MSISKRISQIIETEKITISALERSIGASEGVLRHAIRKDSDIQGKWLTKISELYPNISARWLLTGRGEMLSTSEEYAPSSENQGQTILHLAKALQAAQEMINKLKDELDYERSRAGLHAGGVETDDPASVHAG